jgi:hypothetical protein
MTVFGQHPCFKFLPGVALFLVVVPLPLLELSLKVKFRACPVDLCQVFLDGLALLVNMQPLGLEQLPIFVGVQQLPKKVAAGVKGQEPQSAGHSQSRRRISLPKQNPAIRFRNKILQSGDFQQRPQVFLGFRLHIHFRTQRVRLACANQGNDSRQIGADAGGISFSPPLYLPPMLGGDTEGGRPARAS